MPHLTNAQIDDILDDLDLDASEFDGPRHLADNLTGLNLATRYLSESAVQAMFEFILKIIQPHEADLVRRIANNRHRIAKRHQQRVEVEEAARRG